eukprot:jgi/Ulvmu1/9346/UM050_0098.1
MESLFEGLQLRLDSPVCGICLWSRGLVAGTTSGAVYVVTKTGDHWEVPQRAVRLSKEPVQHMIRACDQSSTTERLVAITDEGVTMFALPDLSLKGQAFRTKGATAMSWQTCSQTLAVARPGSLGKPNQVELFVYKNKSFSSVRKLNVPDSITQLFWLSNDLLCASEPSLVSIASAAEHTSRPVEVIRWTSRAPCALAATSACTATVFQGGMVHYFTTAVGQATGRWLWEPGNAEAAEAAAEPGRTATPGLLPCYPYMLLSGVAGEFEVHLTMPEAAHTDVQTVRIPEALDESESVASTVGGGLPWRRNRRLLEPGVLLAGLAAEGAAGGEAAARSGVGPHTVAAVSRGSCIVQVLELRPLKEQLDVLVAKGRIREALAVCEALDGEAQDPGILDRLRVALGVQLCDEGDLDQGLSEIASASRTYPLAMLQYFPTLLPDPKAALASMDRSHMSSRTRTLLGLSAATDPSPRWPQPPAAISAKPRSRMGESAASMGDPSAAHIRHGSGADGAADAYAAAMDSAQLPVEPGSAWAAGAAVQPVERPSAAAAAAAGNNPALALPYLVTFRSRMLSRTAEEAAGPHARQIVDMALLLGWLQGAEHAALLAMLRQPNAVPLVQGRAALRAAGMYLELIELYEGRGKHVDALDTYRDLCVRPHALQPPPRGVSAGLTGRLAANHALSYLMRIPDDAGAASALICRSLEQWLLQADPDGSKDLLLGRRPVVPPVAALSALHAAAPDLAAPYLEAAIDTGIATAEEFHTTLANIYFAALAAPAAVPVATSSPASPAWPAPGASEANTTRKLLAIIKESPFVQPEELLRQMPEAPTRSLLLARAALQERQHQYEAALHVYAHRLRDHAAAEAFADRLYDSMMQRVQGPRQAAGTARRAQRERLLDGLVSVPAVQQPRDVYTWVLRTLLHPPDHAQQERQDNAGGRGEAGSAAGTPGADAEAKTEAAATLQYVLLLIGRKWERMDVAAALDCLPAGTKVKDMGACVSALSVGIMRRSNGRTLHASLLNAYRHQLCYESMMLEDKQVEAMDYVPTQPSQPDGHTAVTAQTQPWMHQTANDSIGTLLAHEHLVESAQQQVAPPVSLFAGIPPRYTCHSSMRRIAWQRTLRSAMDTSATGRSNVEGPQQPWISPAQLAAYSMALQLPPPAGFNHMLLRYPAGRGFTQRVGYPFAGAPAQYWTDLPRRDVPAAASRSGSTMGGPHALFAPLNSTLTSSACSGPVIPTAHGPLPRIDEEFSAEEGVWAVMEGCGRDSWRGLGASERSADSCMHGVLSGDADAWGGHREKEGGRSHRDGVRGGGGASGGSVDGGVEAATDCDGWGLEAAGGSSMAGPAPLDVLVAAPAHACMAADAPQRTGEAVTVSVDAGMPVMIRPRGRRAPVVARVATKAALQYTALDAGDEDAAQRAQQDTLSQPQGAAGGHATRAGDVDMFSWINDRAIGQAEADSGPESHGRRDGRPARTAGLPHGAGAKEQHACGNAAEEWADAALEAGRALVGAGQAGPAAGGRSTQHGQPDRLVIVPRTEPLLEYGCGAEVAWRLAPMTREATATRPRLGDVHPAAASMPVAVTQAAERAWLQALSGPLGLRPHHGSELSVIRPRDDSGAAVTPTVGAHSRVAPARQLPPLTPCPTPDVPSGRISPTVGGRACGSGLSDPTGSITVKLSSTGAASAADGGSPLWKLLPQHSAAELVSEASQRRLEVADESLRCMHDEKVPGGPQAAAGGCTGPKKVPRQLVKDLNELLQQDAGLRMALALQGQSGPGAAGSHATQRHASLKMLRSRAPAKHQRSESAIAAWKG